MKKMIFWIYLYIFKNKVYRVYRAIDKADSATKRRIKATKLRIMVENNKEINILNYWYYRYFNNDWKNISVN